MLSNFKKIPVLVRFVFFYLIVLYIVPIVISPDAANSITFMHRFLISSTLTYISHVAIKDEKPFIPEVVVESKILEVSPGIIQSDLVAGSKDFEIIISADGMEVVMD